jgi:hypothetical protein
VPTPALQNLSRTLQSLSCVRWQESNLRGKKGRNPLTIHRQGRHHNLLRWRVILLDGRCTQFFQ